MMITAMISCENDVLPTNRVVGKISLGACHLISGLSSGNWGYMANWSSGATWSTKGLGGKEKRADGVKPHTH